MAADDAFDFKMRADLLDQPCTAWRLLMTALPSRPELVARHIDRALAEQPGAVTDYSF
jgi:hypothetical protein